ncbi:MAG: hypothetical protein H6679_05950 [Epsilonproteobacteria bacterium]|nr:hypothetical protein [Campylobacterota bacterium]
MNNRIQQLCSALLWSGATYVSSCIKISTLVGSSKFMLSPFAFIVPLVGGLFSPISSVVCFIASWGLLHTLGAKPLVTMGIPTLFATLSLALSSRTNRRAHRLLNVALHVLVPAFCMGIFITHDGIQGWAMLYSAYWLVPIALHSFARHSLLARMLQSTFLAHAIGSIMWLYTVPMTSEQWTTLIPLVAVERLTFAVIATGVLVLIRLASQQLSYSLKKEIV